MYIMPGSGIVLWLMMADHNRLSLRLLGYFTGSVNLVLSYFDKNDVCHVMLKNT